MENWKEDAKALMREINSTMKAISEIRDAVQSWGMTRKQADKLCMTFFQGALESGKEDTKC